MLEDFITNLLIVIAVTSLFGYLGSVALRSKATRDVATGALSFRYISPYRVLAAASLLLPGAMCALSLHLYRSGESDFFIWFVIFIVFGAMSVFLLLECFVVRLLVSEEAITSISPWSGRRMFSWAEIESISYSKTSKWYVIVGPFAKKIRASEYLSGISELVSELRKRIAPEKWA